MSTFDSLTKQLSNNDSITRRGVLKRLALATFAGAGAAAVLATGASANTQACMRLGQTPTQATPYCCNGLTVDQDGTCKVNNGGACYETGNCLAGSACTPKAHGMGSVCTIV